MKEILDGLGVLHSFHDRLRFFPGGLDSLKAQFRESNGITQTKKSLKYLLFGKGDLVQRMSDVLFDDVYKLHQFGTANVQELVGWISPENLPVINGRTTKILRYFGFNVRQLD